MEVITSKKNDKIVYLNSLKDKKNRTAENKFVAESEKVILEAINSGYKLDSLFVEQGKNLNCLNPNNYKTYFISEAVMKGVSSLVTPQGVVAIFEKKEPSKQVSDRVLILDALQDPNNLGAIIRSAVASNFTTIFLINCCDEYSDKVLRASMGNLFKANLIKTDYQDLRDMISDYTIYSADMKGDNIFEVKMFDKKVAIAIGNEGNGLSEEMRNMSSKFISIPMSNNVESLNATVSASIIMFQIANR